MNRFCTFSEYERYAFFVFFANYFSISAKIAPFAQTFVRPIRPFVAPISPFVGGELAVWARPRIFVLPNQKTKRKNLKYAKT